jgi:hypothetical protein
MARCCWEERQRQLRSSRTNHHRRSVHRKLHAQDGCIIAPEGIDFSKPVRVCNRLPDGIYVQFVDHHFGSWFTHIGLRPDQVGLAEGQRKPERFRPVGVVAGLESTASAVKDYWTKGVVHESLDPTSGRRGQLTQGGGAQYLVLNRFQMEQV